MDTTRAYSLSIRHNVSADAYEDMLRSQGGRCAGCRRTTDQLGEGAVLAVDHDHACCPGSKSCGECVRGLLCLSCNTMLGHADDEAAVLISLANYLLTRGDAGSPLRGPSKHKRPGRRSAGKNNCRRAVLAYLDQQEDWVKVLPMSVAIGFSSSGTGRVVGELREAGLVESEGKTNGNRVRISATGRAAVSDGHPALR